MKLRVVVLTSVMMAGLSAAHAESAGRGSNLGGGFIEFLFTGGAGPVPDSTPGRDLSPPAQQSTAAPRQVMAAVSTPQRPQIDPKFERQVVAYDGPHRPGTIVIDTNERFLYLVQPGGTAIRYGVGVGRPGFEWAGRKTITRKAEWPDWRPPAEMLLRRPDLPTYMEGGPRNPLGARALYLGSSLYRIHGSNEPWTIGHAVSSGCIRMRNEDVTDLYERVNIGTPVIVM